MREAFGREGYLPRAGFLYYAIEDYPLRIVALDTHIPGEHGGLLCVERLAWFDSALSAAPERPTVVLMHHPPFATGIAHMDRYGLRDIAAFAEIVSRNQQIERILCGHLHRAIDRRFAGTVAGTAPSTAHQLLLDLEPQAPLQFVLEPPGYQLHLVRGYRARQPHRDVRRLARLLSVSRRRLSFHRAIARSEPYDRDRRKSH
jgi:3',5'-cyclic AMP phosphodiesterase CpdA